MIFKKERLVAFRKGENSKYLSVVPELLLIFFKSLLINLPRKLSIWVRKALRLLLKLIWILTRIDHRAKGKNKKRSRKNYLKALPFLKIIQMELFKNILILNLLKKSKSNVVARNQQKTVRKHLHLSLLFPVKIKINLKKIKPKRSSRARSQKWVNWIRE